MYAHVYMDERVPCLYLNALEFVEIFMNECIRFYVFRCMREAISIS